MDCMNIHVVGVWDTMAWCIEVLIDGLRTQVSG